MYIIDPDSYKAVFVLPAGALNELKLANGEYLKALVFAFAHAGTPQDAASVAEGTGLSPETAADALKYWAGKGFLADEAKPPVPAAADAAGETAPEKAPEKPKKETVAVKPQKPSYEMICKRLAEDANVRELFSEAQAKLGRTIGTADEATLLLLYDYYGLPVEVILTICEYARLNRKERSMGYIYTVGVDWSRREIDSLEAAEDELRRLESIDKNWPAFARAAGLKAPAPNAAQKKYLATWIEDWHFTVEMLTLACEETQKNAGKLSFPYINKILEKWRLAGVDTPEKAALEELKFREAQLAAAAKRKPQAAAGQPQPKRSANDLLGPASYDLAKAEHKMNTTVPKLKKKEKR